MLFANRAKISESEVLKIYTHFRAVPKGAPVKFADLIGLLNWLLQGQIGSFCRRSKQVQFSCGSNPHQFKARDVPVSLSSVSSGFLFFRWSAASELALWSVATFRSDS